MIKIWMINLTPKGGLDGKEIHLKGNECRKYRGEVSISVGGLLTDTS